MKSLMTIAAGLLLMASVTSCEKCYICEKDTITGTDSEQVCDNAAQAQNRAEALEADGYACSVK